MSKKSETFVALHSKQDKSVRSKQDRVWRWAVEELDGVRVLIRRGGEDGVIAVGVEATNDSCTGRFVDAQTLAGDGDTTIGIDAGGRTLAPNVGPPRAVRYRA